MNAELLARFGDALGEGGVLTGAEVSGRLAGWGRKDGLRCWALLRPRSTEEVARVLRLCNEAGQPVVTHGGLTGLARGGDTSEDEVVLSLERMREIEAIDPIGRTATVQAGVTLQALQEAAEAHGLAFPLDLGARGSATLGGNAATNAGGNRVIRYGMMRDMVLGVEAVLADGTVVPAMNRMIKNNAGYDLKHLFVGSEGTLGVITRLVLRLRERATSQNTAFVAVPSFSALASLLKHADKGLGGTLSAFEVMWPEFYALVTTAPATNRPPLAHGHPYYVLVESLGADPERDAARFAEVMEAALEQGLIADAAIAHSLADRQAMWAMRDDVAQLFRLAPMCLFDVSLPIAEMESYVAEIRADLEREFPGARCVIFGHLGDGNLHIVAAVGSGDARTHERVDALVYGPLARRGGSVSAEHGIGLEKRPYLPLCRSPAEIGLMRTLKGALDPRNILNPGRVL